MARKPQINYWSSRRGFYCWHKGKQVLLATGPDDRFDGPTYRAAREAFNALVFPRPEGPTVAELVAKWLVWIGQHRARDTLRSYTGHSKIIVAGLGDKPVSQLVPYDVDAWCQAEAQRRKWSDATTRTILTAVESLLRWGKQHGLIATNPVPKLEKPREVSRGLECVLTLEQEDAVIAAARSRLRLLVQVLRDTGARPGELRKAEARHYDPAIHAIVYEGKSRRGQTGHKTDRSGKPRVIYLFGESRDLIPRLCELHPSGPLFRANHRAKTGVSAGMLGGWTKRSLTSAFARLRMRAGLKTLMPYSFRHTFACNWLTQGRPIETLAVMLGTSAEMIRRHYGHHADQQDYIISSGEDFARKRRG